MSREVSCIGSEGSCFAVKQKQALRVRTHPTVGEFAMQKSALLTIGCFLAGVVFSSSVFSQTPSAERLDPVPPFGSDAAVQALERFIGAFNATDPVRLTSSFASTAKAYLSDVQGEFGVIDWLDNPWQYHQLQARQLAYGTNGWEVNSEYRATLVITERIVSGNFVTQKEHLIWRGPGSEQGTVEQMVLYQVRNGRIYRLWLLPWEEVSVPEVVNPRYPEGNGPIVWIDTWHGNGGAPDGTFYPFAELLRHDGYQVRAWEREFKESDLKEIGVLVIANAMPHEADDPMRAVPFGTRDIARALPSAFTQEEEITLRDWVAGGGALLLIADHAPMTGPSMSLAALFGAEFHNGNVRDTTKSSGGGDLFRRSDGTLRAHVITDGRVDASRVDSVMTYLGQAFQGSAEIEPLLVLSESMVLTTSSPDGDTRRIPVGGWMQAGVLEFERGRVALFGEAWMFRFLTNPHDQNARFIRNLMSWLSSRKS